MFKVEVRVTKKFNLTLKTYIQKKKQKKSIRSKKLTYKIIL